MTTNVTEAQLIDSLFRGPLKEQWLAVVEEINNGQDGAAALRIFNNARRKLCKRALNRKLPSNWPGSPEFQMELLREYGIPPQVTWGPEVINDGVPMRYLLATRDKQSGGDFPLVANLPAEVSLI